jgi:hypothetical protein
MILSVLFSVWSISSLAAENNAGSFYLEGMNFFEKEDFDKAFPYFQIAGAEKNYAPAQNMLGVCYRDGLGAEQDLSEAEKYFRLSSDQGYAPAQENLIELESRNIAELKKIEVGSSIQFGAYEQDNDLTNGKEPIEWQVLEVRENKALLISKYGLDYQQYNTEYTNITWEDSTLRKWLNRDFLKDAFSITEQDCILITTVTADKNPEYDTDPGNATEDKIFILSVEEAYNYFPSDEDRCCEATTYAEMARTRRNGAGTRNPITTNFSWFYTIFCFCWFVISDYSASVHSFCLGTYIRKKYY